MVAAAFALMTAAALGHSQNYGMKQCQDADGTIAVDNPAISSTYWLRNSTCTFTLPDMSGKSIDAITVTRSSSPDVAGVLTLANGTQHVEDVDVDGEGEPFALLPMYSTITLKHVTTTSVTMEVRGKAMVSFGMAEDPKLVFYEVVRDAYEARHWVYGAATELWLIHIGMLVVVLFALGFGTWNAARWFPSYLSGLRTSYDTMYQIAPAVANFVLALSTWIDVSFVFDNFWWAGRVWHRIGNAGGALFVIVVLSRCLFYVYLAYVLWETPYKLGSWTLLGKRWLVPVAINGVLTAYVFAWLYMGRDAVNAGYYVGIPSAIALACIAVPVYAALQQPGKYTALAGSGSDEVYIVGTYLGHLALVTLVGIVLNVGYGLLAPLCMLAGYYKRYRSEDLPESPRQLETLYDYRWRIFSIGVVTALPPWLSIFATYSNSVSNSDVPVPWFVTVIVIALFVWFSSFAVVMVWRLRDNVQQTTSKLNVVAEKRYIALSFISKATLAWLLWAGAFRRSQINLQQASLPSCS